MRRLLRFKRACRNVWLVWCLAGCLVGMRWLLRPSRKFCGNPDSSAFIRIPKDTDDWTRHFRIGALVGMNISANFSMNGTVQHFRQQPGQRDL